MNQSSTCSFQHTVCCEIWAQSAGTPLFAPLNRKIAEGRGNGLIRHEQHGQLGEELYLSPTLKDVPRPALQPPRRWSRSRQSSSNSEARKIRTRAMYQSTPTKPSSPGLMLHLPCRLKSGQQATKAICLADSGFKGTHQSWVCIILRLKGLCHGSKLELLQAAILDGNIPTPADPNRRL